MKDYVDYMIDNKKSMSSAKSMSKKNDLIKRIKEELGLNASRSLTIKDLNEYFA